MMEQLNRLPSQLLAHIIQAQIELARSGPDFGLLLERTAASAAHLANAEGAVVELVEDTDIVYRATYGMADVQLGLRMPIAGSLSGLCLGSKHAAVCTDSETDQRVNRDACRRVGLRSMTIVPMMFDDHAAGVLKLMWREPRALDQYEQDIAQAIANMAAALMHHISRQGDDALRRGVTSDPVTRLPNRASFYELLRARLARAESGAEQLGVALLAVGEENKPWDVPGQAHEPLTQEISRRILGECRSEDIVTRIGPGLFAIILSVAGRRSVVLSQATRIAHAVTASSIELEGMGAPRMLAVASSAARYPDDGRSVTELVYAAQAGLLAGGHASRSGVRLEARH